MSNHLPIEQILATPEFPKHLLPAVLRAVSARLQEIKS